MIACTSCRFHDDSYGNNCSHIEVMKPDPVHGMVLETCHNARAETGKCGLDAKYYTANLRSVVRSFWGCSNSPAVGKSEA